MTPANPILSADPIRFATEDLFGRGRLAVSLADLIAGFSPNSSVRIGLYGGWGSGKTSVLEMLDRELRDRGFSPIRIVPWAATGDQQVLEVVLEQIADELDIRRGKWRDRFRRASTATEMAEGLGFAATASARVLGATLDAVTDRMKDPYGLQFIEQVVEGLRKKRIVLIVDDLDRADPALLPRFLLGLREGLNLPGLHHVLALSPRVVEQGLHDLNPGWSDEPQEFLGKIIDYPFTLSPPSDKQLRTAVEGLLGQLPRSVDSGVIMGLLNHLPRNPRQLKLFLRYLAALDPILRRFSPAEIDLHRTYLISMLRVEFPLESESLFADKNSVESLDSGFSLRMIREMDKGRTEQEARQEPEEKYTPDNPERAERFMLLCGALRRQEFYPGDLRSAEMYHLLESPPIMTRLEFDRFVSEASELGDDQLDSWLGGRIRAWTTPHPNEATEAVWKNTLKGRETILGLAADTHLKEESLALLNAVRTMDRILRSLGEYGQLWDAGGVPVQAWIDLVHQANRWRKFTGAYEPQREAERELIYDLFQHLEPNGKALALPLLKRLEYESREGTPELTGLLDTLGLEADEAASQLALTRFEIRGGLVGMWAPDGSEAPGSVAFNPKSAFHTEEGRSRLEALATQAVKDPIIQNNFLEYFRILLSGAAGGASPYPHGYCRTLLGDKSLLDIVWPAAVATPLNPRVVGSLDHDIQRAHELGVVVADRTMPEWWQVVQDRTSPEPSDAEPPEPAP